MMSSTLLVVLWLCCKHQYTKRTSNAWSPIQKVLMMLVLQSNTRGKPKLRNMDYTKLFAAVSAVAAG
jgi:hypothetical protein